VSLALNCRCGGVGLALDEPQRAVRGACYCRDCRAYAYFLGRESELLDAWGGTEIVAVLPSRLRFERGRERIACASLSERGILRWYASCCRSPIGNTPRDGGVPHLGLIPTCLLASRDAAEAEFGPLRVRVFRASARGEAPKMGAGALVAGARYLRETLGARLGASARENPFFASDLTTPIVVPSVLSETERARVAKAAR
jgi:hypothetical protein